ncbi:hypothetical protein M9Y10_007254 [Tritrichomonas musculus]|uniref:Protein kinase domain-containing protein n=1 Tax=Tritrichomonas musculus TaxID=1915356 RepID=A0ABR2J3C7_9EUKA
MDISQYIQKNTDIYHNILEFIDSGTDDEKEYQKIFQSLETTNKDEVRLFILMIFKISQNHFRFPYFFKKIESLILHFESQIKIFFNDDDIYNMFENSPRVLLFLIQKGFCTSENIDHSDLYFYPEIRNKIKEEKKENLENQIQKIDPIEVFESKRLIGENDSEICKLIREDSVVEFITYVSANIIDVSSQTPYSIYETNSFLLSREKTSLIEYAAFFGSNEIFKYLRINGAKIESIIWFYAIHGKNAEIIRILERDGIKRDTDEKLSESIKCHHNEIANYFEMNEEDSDHYKSPYMSVDEDKEAPFGIANYNFDFIPKDFFQDKLSFFYLCEYKYFELARLYLKSMNIDPSFLIQAEDFEEIDTNYNFRIAKKIGTEDKYVLKNVDKKDIYHALKIKMKVKYPCLMELIGYSPINPDISDYPSFWYKYYENGSLEEYLKDKNFDKKNPKNYILILGIAIAIHYIQKNYIRHLKFFPSKIFIDENFYPIVSGYTEKPLMVKNWESDINAYSTDDIVHVAPERIKCWSFFYPESNVFSYGIMLYRFFTGKDPYPELKSHSSSIMARRIATKRRPDLHIMENKVFTHLLDNCFEYNPSYRMDFEMIIDYITNEEFYSYYEDLDHESVKKYLDIFGNDFNHLKNKF